jgi:hypothetical protein
VNGHICKCACVYFQYMYITLFNAQCKFPSNPTDSYSVIYRFQKKHFGMTGLPVTLPHTSVFTVRLANFSNQRFSELCAGRDSGVRSKWGAAGLRPPTSHPNRKLQNPHFIDTIISTVLCDLTFGRNQPLKWADD